MDYIDMHDKVLYHSTFVEKEIQREKARLNPVNRDFLQDLPYCVSNILDDLCWKYGTCDWFNEAWEKYRKHILDAGLGGKYKMPGFVFNSYIEDEIKKQNKELSGESVAKHCYNSDDMEDYLEHHGIKGQRWGIRRYQNEDGTLTKDGKARRDRERYQKAAGTSAGALLGATFGVATALERVIIRDTKTGAITSSSLGLKSGLGKARIAGRAIVGGLIGGFAGKKIADIRANNQRAKEWQKFQNKAVENQTK